MTQGDVIKDFVLDSIGLDNDRIDLMWGYVNPAEALSYEVWIERAGAMSGPFSTIAQTYGSVHYIDRHVDYDMTQNPFYRLRVVKRDTRAVVQVTPPKFATSAPDLIVAEIRRRSNLLLREYTGVPVLYYPVRNTGVRCPDCWGGLEQQKTKSHCTSCFDTGYLSGYYNPILMWINIHEDPNTLAQNAETDEVPVRTGTALMTGLLPIAFGDLVLEGGTYERWLVSSWDRTEKLRVSASYHIRLHQVVETDVRFRVPLPQTDVFDRLPKSREFTRAYTLNP